MNEITTQQDQELNIVAPSSSALILDVASMDSIMRMADLMAKGRSTIPAHFHGNAADCAAVIMQSMQWRMNPFGVAQKTHIVNGTLGYEAQLVNAVIQSSGVTEDRFNYDWYGPWEKIIGKSKVIQMPAKDGKKAYEFRVPDYGMNDEAGCGVRVWATLKGEDVPRVLDLLLVQASVRNSPLWATDPKQQLAYLAVKRWSRLYSPDVILGVYTPDELDERPAPPQARNMGAADVVGKQSVPAASDELIGRAAAAAVLGIDSYKKFWAALGGVDKYALKQHHDAFKEEAQRADAERTFDQPAQAATASPELEALAADIGAAADEGIDALERAWSSLSAATQSALAGHYPAMKARAESVEVEQ